MAGKQCPVTVEVAGSSPVRIKEVVSMVSDMHADIVHRSDGPTLYQ